MTLPFSEASMSNQLMNCDLPVKRLNFKQIVKMEIQPDTSTLKLMLRYGLIYIYKSHIKHNTANSRTEHNIAHNLTKDMVNLYM
jgi:hypothetical protein